MKIKPILFSAPMIRALLDGRKTQTRRLKFEYEPGDLLWVRETYVLESNRDVSIQYPPPFSDGRPLLERKTPDWGDYWVQPHYRATDPAPELDQGEDGPTCKWRPSIFMPRWASRFTQEVTAVRKERLQDISEEDALAEGAMFHNSHGVGQSGYRHDIDHGFVYSTAKQSYAALWESINGKGSWADNPGIDVISFKTHRMNIDQFLKQKEAA